jgi:hypothetical protein
MLGRNKKKKKESKTQLQKIKRNIHKGGQPV